MKHYNINSKSWFKIMAMVLVCLFTLNSATQTTFSSEFSSEVLSAQSSIQLKDFANSYVIASICTAIERHVDLDDEKAINNILKWVNSNPDLNVTITSPSVHEIVLDVPSEQLAVRYFFPGKAPIITPFSDVLKLATKEIKSENSVICRQVIHRIKALNAFSRGSITAEGILLERSVNPEMDMIEADLRDVRDMFSKGEYAAATPLIEKTIEKLKEILFRGMDPEDPLLAYYYTAKVMLKVARFHDKMFLEGKEKNSIQILLFDRQSQFLLLQKRGPFKRLFPSALAVTATAKEGDFYAKTVQNVEKAVEDETGVVVSPHDTLKFIGPERSHENIMMSFDFYAFSLDENEKLKKAYETLCERVESSGVFINYNPAKRSLCVFTVDPQVKKKDLIEIAEEIKQLTDIPYIYPVNERNANSLMIIELRHTNERLFFKRMDEKKKAREEALYRLKYGGVTEEDLKLLDSDTMVFQHWDAVRRGFMENPQSYALDLAGLYFSSDNIWQLIAHTEKLDIISVDDSRACFVSVAGGKGHNTHIMRGRLSDNKGLLLTDADAVTSFAYERYVLSNARIKKYIHELEKSKSDVEVKRLSEKIRRLIKDIELPDGFREKALRSFNRLGRDVAIRSSATVEDLKGHAAAGRADSFLHTIDEDEFFQNIKNVWASLFSDGFVTYRNIHGMGHVDARMPVMIQKFVGDVKAAGVVTSIHAKTGRLIYNVTAQPGLGEGVVEGRGRVDTWNVGLLGDLVLEKHIPHKGSRVIPREEGGIVIEKIDMEEPSLSEEDVLRLVSIVREIHDYYRQHNLAKNVDVEFAVTNDGRIHVLQVRSEPIRHIEIKKDKEVFIERVVDENSVPEGTPVAELPENCLVACPGAVTAEIQIVGESGGPLDARPGVIVVTNHTNNEWNDVFARLAGVITMDGGDTSHAAKNSRDMNIPCIVGVSNAVFNLKVLNGKTVTLDASRRKIYLGKLPIIEEERELDVWISDPAEVEAAVKRKEVHSAFRTWKENHLLRSGVYKRYFDGLFRRRSYKDLGYFELDYYWRAWDHLTEKLNKKFRARSPWTLAAQERAVKHRGLFHKEKDFDRKSVFYFLADLENASLEDLETLFEDRQSGFRHASQFFGSLEGIDGTNVEKVVDELVEVFAQMHFAFWLNACIDTLFVFDHLKYVDPLYREPLRNVSVEDLPPEERVNISRNKDLEIYSLLEIIRGKPQLRAIFTLEDTSDIISRLRAEFPDALKTVESWSNKYKKASEDIRILSDTDEYIVDLKARLERATVAPSELVAYYYKKYLQ
ncbi:MAG: hypothetical protein HQ594_02290, partial [Candidatus Omnitrophica bacterium]|nr:hypothetical protein [Candidatus Omnitrophota bacterium]